ncbi:hypothetical protein ARMSODRAFT_979866 [Armillaria solidipes]|uniref:Uncharacterized protein n=1 Tax=Armillaria solidipes TaxID=1076256 RepID=A0A2H3AXN8_9AGAR|nr:hypothetical protein ARMSODRAFT_979866 [Armillaria solidipes]
MARRSAPPNSGPAYIPKNQHVQRRAIHDPNESAFTRFLREEIYAPEKLPGNISIVVGVSTFIGGILAVRTWGEYMVLKLQKTIARGQKHRGPLLQDTYNICTTGNTNYYAPPFSVARILLEA